MINRGWNRRRGLLRVLLAGGLLFQAASTSCSDVTVQALTSLSTSIANQFIRNVVTEWLNTSTLSGF